MELDTQPGNYYVSVIDGSKSAKLLGPFHNNHQTALDMVDAVRKFCIDKFPTQATFASFGTCRIPDDDSVPVRFGSLNVHFGYPT